MKAAVQRGVQNVRDRNAGAVVIQAHCRGRAARRNAGSATSAVEIQRTYRGWSARRRVDAFWEWWEVTIEEDAATKIQAVGRGRACRRRLAPWLAHEKARTTPQPRPPPGSPPLANAAEEKQRRVTFVDGKEALALPYRPMSPGTESAASDASDLTDLSDLSEESYWEAVVEHDAASRYSFGRLDRVH